ncbi:hypothetical protein V0288_19965 [Pannus brasiliensis CCIBt3594]|uniref:Uncharacterized protein n=1 Tax=Pannus brasiliensis CCIBt3594 TaxID=1427578 RepID=A0AAW9QZH9_9CHRO
MNQAQLIHSAKQGDTDSLTKLLNQSLSSRRVEIFEAVLEEGVLVLKLRSPKVPNQHKLVPFISEELGTLGIRSIERVTIHAFTGDAPHPLWEKSISLDRAHSLVNHVAKIDSRPTIVEESVENEAMGTEFAENTENGEVSYSRAEDETDSESAESETSERTPPSRRAIEAIPERNSGRSWLSVGMMLAFLSIGFGLGLLTGDYIGYRKATGELSPPAGANAPSP